MTDAFIDASFRRSVGFELNGTHPALQNCMSLILKTKEVLRVALRILSSLFILNNTAERVGFEFG